MVVLHLRLVTLDDGSNEDPFTVGETPIVTQPGCNSDELGSIELEMNGGVQPYDIKWYKLSVAQESALLLQYLDQVHQQHHLHQIQSNFQMVVMLV